MNFGEGHELAHRREGASLNWDALGVAGRSGSEEPNVRLRMLGPGQGVGRWRTRACRGEPRVLGQSLSGASLGL